MPDLDHWQQPGGWPRDDYFKAVHDSIAAMGIQPEDWWQGDPWEGAIILGEDALTGTRFQGYDEVVVSWRVGQDCEPRHADDFTGDGWYLVIARADNRQVRELARLPYLAEPEQVAEAVRTALTGS
ncbi:hypothetical protein ACFP1Z_28660 [Streptomyces gamaensis]|uniref:DUF317 domain-containing protein n=1 Tax=Streptomyces gamaensis TaxID=1763542 RepID=A0ABW0Z5P3_9ACTN